LTRVDRHDCGVLILGAKGLLGCQLATRTLLRGTRADAPLHCWSSTELDIRDPSTVLERILAVRPGIVLNAAAYTDVDGCESDVERAFAVNADGAKNVADACRAAGSLLVHYSTDFVFDGTSKRPYRTTDAIAPISVYGRSKAAGEDAVRQSGCDHLIVRTSWLFGPNGKNFVDTIRLRAVRDGALRVVADQLGRPTFSVDLADATRNLIDARAKGTVHFCNSGVCSWHALATEIVRLTGVACDVAPITSDELSRPARRPAYSVLDTTEYERITGICPRPWGDALAQYLSEGAPASRVSAARISVERTSPV